MSFVIIGKSADYGRRCIHTKKTYTNSLMHTWSGIKDGMIVVTEF